MEVPPQREMMRLILGRVRAKGYLGSKEAESISSRLRIPSSRVYGFASQFDELPQHPYRARVHVCAGPACAATGSWDLLEVLGEKAPAGVEVRAASGIARAHRSPAVCLEVAGEGARLLEGMGPEDALALLEALEGKGPPPGRPLEDVPPSGVEGLSGRGLTPWSAATAEGALPASWGPEMVRGAGDRPGGVLRRMEGNAEGAGSGRRGKRGPLTLLCDTVGREAENSASFAVSILHPRAVAAGAALAAAACGARELLFYLPWNDVAGDAFERAAAELLDGVGIRYSFFRGPVQVPCAWDVGRAAVINGMMLWRAASLYGWSGTRGGDPSLEVLEAEVAWRLPWLAQEGYAREEGGEDTRLRCLVGRDGTPRFLEVPPGTAMEDLFREMGLEGGSIKAVHAGGTIAATGTSRAAHDGLPGSCGEAVLLDAATCMPRWALYQAWYAERACCGGCVPGRTAPAAAARLIRGILRADAGETALESLASLLAEAGELALCPRLRETLQPVLACLRGFRDEFEAHANEGVCRSSSCPPAVEAATYGG